MSTNETERDTHFQEFAKLLWEELTHTYRLWIDTTELDLDEKLQLIIARHAYDLVFHSVRTTPNLGYTCSGDVPDWVIHEDISRIPDMTAFPE